MSRHILTKNLSRDEYQRLVDTARMLGRERLALLLETICATGIRARSKPHSLRNL